MDGSRTELLDGSRTELLLCGASIDPNSKLCMQRIGRFRSLDSDHSRVITYPPSGDQPDQTVYASRAQHPLPHAQEGQKYRPIFVGWAHSFRAVRVLYTPVPSGSLRLPPARAHRYSSSAS